MESQHAMVTIVTGANTGIGRETARGLAAKGATVIIAVRDVAKGEAARADIVETTGNDRVEVIPLDLASVEPSISGPKQPQQRIALKAAGAKIGDLLKTAGKG